MCDSDFLTPITLRANGTEVHCLDLTPRLQGNATSISSLTSLEEIGTSTLTISGAAVLEGTFTDQSDSTITVAAGKGVKASFSATQAGTYYVRLKVVLNDGTAPAFVQRVVVK
jgi:hypothetical protein